ncbi:hypothetical protein GOODEAATRI_013213 [Goodea atripinnis]|uniref:Uncharacterized protein n=1 Tax=Goodea atripinnis TaxID=208336 RepID=A0ABV0PN91_9TELE
MHHGCWRTHMHRPRHRLSHPISLSSYAYSRELIPLCRSNVWPWPSSAVPASRLMSVNGQMTCPKLNQNRVQSQKSSLRLISGTALHFSLKSGKCDAPHSAVTKLIGSPMILEITNYRCFCDFASMQYCSFRPLAFLLKPIKCVHSLK